MAVEIKKLENSNVELVLTLEGEEVKKAKGNVLKKIAKEVELPGFRKGKAPIATVEAKFSENIKEEVTDIFGQSSFKALYCLTINNLIAESIPLINYSI